MANIIHVLTLLNLAHATYLLHLCEPSGKDLKISRSELRLSDCALCAVSSSIVNSASGTYPFLSLIVSAIFAFVGARLDFSECVRLQYVNVLASGAWPL